MFKLMLCLALVAVALSERWGDNWHEELGNALQSIDSIHSYRVQYDDAHDIFLFVNADNCYIVEANSERWDDVVHNTDTLHKFTETVYDQIQTNTGVSKLTHQQAIDSYHSRLEEWECRSKDVFKVAFQRPAGATTPAA
nr:hypothetical protein BaRGS_011530 [Batillaria attramentaria]